jgi:hypothetical protein
MTFWDYPRNNVESSYCYGEQNASTTSAIAACRNGNEHFRPTPEKLLSSACGVKTKKT